MLIVLTDLPWFVQISCRCIKRGWILNFSSPQHFSALLTSDSATVEAELGPTADAPTAPSRTPPEALFPQSARRPLWPPARPSLLRSEGSLLF